MEQRVSRAVLELGRQRVAVEAVRRILGGAELSIGGRKLVASLARSDNGGDLMLDGRAAGVRIARRPGSDLVHVEVDGEVLTIRAISRPEAAGTQRSADDANVVAPMPGQVVSVSAKLGDQVEAGTELLVLESMKLHMSLAAPCAAEVIEVSASPGGLVDKGEILVQLALRQGEDRPNAAD